VALVGDPASSSRLLREAAALAYVDNLDEPRLRTDDAHHLAVVLRLRPGEIVVAADGAGSYRGCRVALGDSAGLGDGARLGSRTGLGDGARLGSRAGLDGGSAPARGGRPRSTGISLVPDTGVMSERRAVPEITVGFSLAKQDRTDWAVAKLAELGVDRIVPLVCERTVARSISATGGAKRMQRLRRIALEASMLARRLWLPEVDDPRPLAEALLVLAPAGGIALAEPGCDPPSLATPVVLVGPEGGWSPRELSYGLPTVRLGDTILRVETAAVVAGALLACLRSGTVGTLQTKCDT
jgi:16S rRNA (uracil1498-N3)-methyltransferase